MAKIVYRGSTYPVIDPTEWLLAEAAFIKRQIGQTVAEAQDNAQRGDAEAIVAYLYVAKKRAGEKVHWEDFEDFTVGECDFVRDDEERSDYSDTDKAKADADEGGTDPTSPTGTTPDPGSSTTSTRSRSTSGSTRGKSKS